MLKLPRLLAVCSGLLILVFAVSLQSALAQPAASDSFIAARARSPRPREYAMVKGGTGNPEGLDAGR